MLLSCDELLERKIVHIDQIQNSLVYVHLDCILLIERIQTVQSIVNLSSKEYPEFSSLNLGEFGYALKPNQFVLAVTQQIFNIPKNVFCEFKLDRKLANMGLYSSSATCFDSLCSYVKLSFGLKNQCEYHSLLLKTGMELGQVFFYQHEG